MAIKTTSTKDLTPPAPATVTAAEVETTHMVFNFSEGAGYLRQVYKDSSDNIVGIRFLKVTGTKYSNVEDSILTKVQKVADDIELDPNLIDGVDIEVVDRGEAFGLIRN